MYDSLLSQLCNQGILSHNMTIPYQKKPTKKPNKKKKIQPYSIIKLLSNSSAINTLPCKLLVPIIHFSFQKPLTLLQNLEVLFQKKKSKPFVPLLPVFLELKSPLFLFFFIY